MKETDYAPRAAQFDALLKGQDLIVCEVGVSAGAHAHALLQYCPIKRLYLVDIWDEANGFTFGFCSGRLLSHGFGSRVEFITKESVKAAKGLPDNFFDAIYLDQKHLYTVVKEDLLNWWPKLKSGGILGHRNYGVDVIRLALDDFVAQNSLSTQVFSEEIILYKP